MSRPRKVYRQGDLILIEDLHVDIDRATMESSFLEIRSENGNAHMVKAPVYSMYGVRYLVVESPSILIHPQHPELVVEPGIYRVEHVRDYALGRALD